MNKGDEVLVHIDGSEEGSFITATITNLYNVAEGCYCADVVTAEGQIIKKVTNVPVFTWMKPIETVEKPVKTEKKK